MKRRNFLKGLPVAALAAGSLTVVAAPQRLRFHEDGITPDNEVLRAWCEGKHVYWADGTPVGDVIENKRLTLTPEMAERSLQNPKTTRTIKNSTVTLKYSDTLHQNVGVVNGQIRWVENTVAMGLNRAMTGYYLIFGR